MSNSLKILFLWFWPQFLAKSFFRILHILTTHKPFAWSKPNPHNGVLNFLYIIFKERKCYEIWNSNKTLAKKINGYGGGQSNWRDFNPGLVTCTVEMNMKYLYRSCSVHVRLPLLGGSNNSTRNILNTTHRINFLVIFLFLFAVANKVSWSFFIS